MGYTHYFNTLVPDERLARITKEIVKESAVTICGGMGTGKPVITEREISLNGDESRREDYETFCIPNREADFGFHNFCKTAHQPYDEVVTAILCAALYLNCKGSDSIHSDGHFKDWYESGGLTLSRRPTKPCTGKSRRRTAYRPIGKADRPPGLALVNCPGWRKPSGNGPAPYCVPAFNNERRKPHDKRRKESPERRRP